MARAVLVGVFALGLSIAGCDCAGETGPNACALDGGPSGCGQACTAARPCSAGTYCNSGGVCTADCSAALPCASGSICGPAGRCIPALDGSMGRDVLGIDAEPLDTTCARFDLGTTRTTPNVLLIIDRSGSMETNDFPAGSGTTRWEALYDGLMSMPDGIVDSLQASVRFGLAMYTEEDGVCPALGTVPCDLDNYAAIDAVYGPASPAGGTPTGDSITAITAMLDTLVTEDADPTIFVLATDGEPDTCEDGNDEVNGRLESIAAVEAAFDMGIRTYVISVGDDVAGTHLQDVANAGLGVGAGGPDAEYWVATDTAGLADALETIVGGVVGCEITLIGEIDPTMACTGEVRIGGDIIACDDPNGWRVIDSTHIELLGTACDRLTSTGEDVTGTFPCEAVLM